MILLRYAWSRDAATSQACSLATTIFLLSEAVDPYKRAISLKPHHVLYLSLSYAYAALGRNQEALEALKESVKLKPEFFLAHYEMGIIDSTIGKHAEALEAFRHAV